MKKIIIMHFFKRMNRGGAEMRTLEIMKNMDRNIFEFHFCVTSSQKGDLDDIIKSLGGYIHICNLDWKFPIHLMRILKDYKVSIIHSHTFMFSGFVNLIAKFCETPMRITHFRSSGDGRKSTLINNIKKTILKFLVNRSSTNILAVSKTTMENAWDKGWEKDDRCKIIYNGIEISKVYKELANITNDVKEELSLSKDSKLVIHIGRNNPAKNHIRLIEIFKELLNEEPKAYLLLVGEVKNKVLDDLINKKNVNENVIYLGVRNDIYRLLHNSDLMIFPSVREGLPGVVIEASAIGLPIIASDLDEIREIDDFPNLRLMNLDNSNRRLAKQALQHMNDVNKNRNLKMSLVNFEKTKFNIVNCVREYSELYRHSQE